MSRWKYTLPDTVRHHIEIPLPGNGEPFHNDWLSIYPNGIIYVRRGYSFDGATLVPDMYCAVKGAVFHDAMYQFATDIAAKWKCKPKQVVRLANRVFYDVMMDNARGLKLVPELYYAGVRLFGYRFWRFMRWIKRNRANQPTVDALDHD